MQKIIKTEVEYRKEKNVLITIVKGYNSDGNEIAICRRTIKL